MEAEVTVKTEQTRDRGDCLGQTCDLTRDASITRKDTFTERTTFERLESSEAANGMRGKTTGAPPITSMDVRFIKKEHMEDEEPVDCNHSNQRRSSLGREDSPHSNASGLYDDDDASSMKERFVDGDITVVQIPTALDNQVQSPEGKKITRRELSEARASRDLEQYPYRVPIVYPMEAHLTDSRSASPSPNGYRLDDREGQSSPIANRKHHEELYWRSESPRSESREDRRPKAPLSPLYPEVYKEAIREGDKGPYSRYVPIMELPKHKRPNGFRRDIRRDRYSTRDEEKEEESLWKQVQRYRHRKRPVLGKLPPHSQEETIFMQYNEIRERRLREGRYIPRMAPKGGGEGEEEGPLPSPSSGGEPADLTAHARISEPIVTSSNPLIRSSGDKGEEFCDDVPSMCNGDLGLRNSHGETKTKEISDIEERNRSPDASRTTQIPGRPNPEPKRNSEAVNVPSNVSPTYRDLPNQELLRFSRSDAAGIMGIRDQEYRHTGMMDYRTGYTHQEGNHCHARFNECGDYSERFGLDDCCHDYSDRRRQVCHHHCCFSMESRSKRKRRRSSETEDYWTEASQEKSRKTGTGMETTRDGQERSPFQNDTHSFSPASSDSRDVEVTSESDKRESRAGPEDNHLESERTSRETLNEIPDALTSERNPKAGSYSEDSSKGLNEDDVVCQVNGLFSLPGYRETKYNITLGELRRRIASPETLTRVEMISYVRQAKTSGRILLDRNGIATSNRSHPSIMSRICEKEAQVLACGLHKMNMEYLPLRKMVQKCVGMYKSRGCDGCQDCRLRLRRRIIDVEITRNMLKELQRVTQESSFDGMLDTFDLASHTFGIPNVMNNIKLIDEYFKMLLLALENE